MSSRLKRGLLDVGISLGAIAAALLVSMCVVLALGKSPMDALDALYQGSLSGEVQIGATAARAIPLVFVALGWIVAFSAGRINIGFVGQIIAGAICATTVGVRLSGLPGIVHLPLTLLAALVGGAIWAGIAAWLLARFGVSEIISTLLLNLVAIQILSWVVAGPLKDRTGTYPRSDLIPDSASWPTLWRGTPLSWDVVFMLVVVAAIALLPRTTLGMRLRLTGGNPVAARYAGIRVRSVSVWALLISGGLAGLAASSMILGPDVRSISEGFQGNVGFDGIVVALVARNRWYAVLPVAFALAALQQGSSLMQVLADVPSAVVALTYGLIIIFVAAASALASRAARNSAVPGSPDEPYTHDHTPVIAPSQ